MHDIKWIRDNPDAFDRALARRGLPAEPQRLIEIDERRRAAIQKAEAALARRNPASREVGAATKSNEAAAAQALPAGVAPPLLVRNDVMFGTAQLPKFAEDQFQTGRLLSDDERASLLQELPEQSLLRLGIEYNLIAQPLWLIPTAEVPLTNLVRQSIL